MCDIAANFNCSHLSTTRPHPTDCCDFPISTVSNSTIKKCYEQCPSLKLSSEYKKKVESDKDKCCVMICMYKEENILVDDKLDKENFRESFKMAAMPNLTDEWSRIINHAVDSCVPLCKNFIC
jgi:hypothetical protein